MSYSKIIWGFILLFIGVILLSEHFGLLNFHWWHLVFFWPVILIIWGVLMLPISDRLKIILSAGIMVITFIVALYISINKPDYFEDKLRFKIHHHIDSDEEWDEPYYDSDSSTTEI